MKITEDKIKNLATLAKLNLKKSEIESMFSDFVQMLDFIDQLEEVNTEAVKPLTHIHETHNIYREDEAIQDNIKNNALRNAASHNSDYFQVSKVIKK